MSTAMNFMKAFLAMNPISKFLSLVNSYFLTLKLVILCYHKCFSKQCNHVYFIVLCTSKFSGSLKSFILIILIIYLLSFFFLRNLLYIFFLFGYYFLFFSLFLRWELLRSTLSNFQVYNTVLSIVVTMGIYTFWLPSSISPECFFHLCQPPVCSLNLWLLVFILASKYKWDHIIFVFVWLISLSMMPSRSVHVVTNTRICFFLWLKNIPLYMCVFLLMLLLALKFCNLKSIFIFYLDSVSHSFKCDINFFFLLYPTSFLHLILLVIC